MDVFLFMIFTFVYLSTNYITVSYLNNIDIKAQNMDVSIHIFHYKICFFE